MIDFPTGQHPEFRHALEESRREEERNQLVLGFVVIWVVTAVVSGALGFVLGWVL